MKLNAEKVVEVTGKLLGYSESMILETKEGVEIYEDVKGVVLPELPDGFLTLPALVWKVENRGKEGFSTECEIAYKATGFSWKSDYTVVLNEEETMMDFAGWVTIENNSGKKYEQARIKLIAGDVNVVTQNDTAVAEGAAPNDEEKVAACPA